jgi:hypothetical protein
MAHMNQDKKKIIKANLDKVLKPLGIKYSLRVRNYMSISCTIRSAPFDMLADRHGDNEYESRGKRYAQVNRFWYSDHYTGRTKDVLAGVVDAMTSADYFDHSDAQIDYFHTAYYFDISIGAWDKPFEVKGTK